MTGGVWVGESGAGVGAGSTGGSSVVGESPLEPTAVLDPAASVELGPSVELAPLVEPAASVELELCTAPPELLTTTVGESPSLTVSDRPVEPESTFDVKVLDVEADELADDDVDPVLRPGSAVLVAPAAGELSVSLEDVESVDTDEAV